MSNKINLSLNELDSLAKRAARGAGYHWGLCEEAAKAVRWLCSHGLDGVGQLALLLEKSLSQSASMHRPLPVRLLAANENDNVTWQAGDQLCPLATGAYLSDSASNLVGREIEIRQLLLPTILIPFAANVASLTKQSISIVCDETVATTDGVNIDMTNPFPDSACDVGLRCGVSMSAARTQQRRVIADTHQLQVLQRFANLTYAPATEESRLTGAGAGLMDND